MPTVLIVRKLTNLEQYQQLCEEQLMPTHLEGKYLAFLQQAHEEHYHCLSLLKSSLTHAGMEIHEADRTTAWPQSVFDFVIALGGDGTLIAASYGVQAKTPLIGVRSSSASVGYLCAADLHSIRRLVSLMVAGHLPCDVRQRLRANILRADGSKEVATLPALNDVLFAASSPSVTTRYSIRLNERVESHKSSGVWIATATGSSAAIAAAGGVSVSATDDRLQFLARELYRGKEDGLVLRHGFADLSKDEFWLENQSPSALLAIDGDKEVIALRFGDRISFTLAEPIAIARLIT